MIQVKYSKPISINNVTKLNKNIQTKSFEWKTALKSWFLSFLQS